jgi:hypothetical protein
VPDPLALDRRAGRHEARALGHPLRRPVPGVDAGGHVGHARRGEPADQGGGGLGRVAAVLPRRADHPGHLGRQPLPHLPAHRGLHEADGLAGLAQPDDPVQPQLVRVARADIPAPVLGPELERAERAAADELVQPRVAEHHGHLLGVALAHRGQPQPRRLQPVSRAKLHVHPRPRALPRPARTDQPHRPAQPSTLPHPPRGALPGPPHARCHGGRRPPGQRGV